MAKGALSIYGGIASAFIATITDIVCVSTRRWSEDSFRQSADCTVTLHIGLFTHHLISCDLVPVDSDVDTPALRITAVMMILGIISGALGFIFGLLMVAQKRINDTSLGVVFLLAALLCNLVAVILYALGPHLEAVDYYGRFGLFQVELGGSWGAVFAAILFDLLGAFFYR